MSSEQLADGVNPLDAELAATWDILKGYSGRDTDLGIARRFGGAAAAYSLRDIGAMNGSVVRVRREPNDTTAGIDDEERFSANQVQDGTLERWVNGELESTLPADVATAAAAYSLRKVKASYGAPTTKLDGSDGFPSNLNDLPLGNYTNAISGSTFTVGHFSTNFSAADSVSLSLGKNSFTLRADKATSGASYGHVIRVNGLNVGKRYTVTGECRVIKGNGSGTVKMAVDISDATSGTDEKSIDITNSTFTPFEVTALFNDADAGKNFIDFTLNDFGGANSGSGPIEGEFRNIKIVESDNRVVRLRRSSDNVEVDVDFDTEGKLSTSSLVGDIAEQGGESGSTTATTLGDFLTEDINIFTDSSSQSWANIRSTDSFETSTALGGEVNYRKFTPNSGVGTSALFGITSFFDVSASSTYTISGQVYVPSGQTTVNAFKIVNGTSGSSPSLSGATNTVPATDQWVDFSFTSAIPIATQFYINAAKDQNAFFSPNGSDFIAFKDITVTATDSGATVHTWYDQAGSNNAVQETAANQPKIAENGALLADGLLFDGSNDSFEATDITDVNFPATVVSVSETNKIGSPNTALYSLNNDSNACCGFYRSTSKYAINNGTTTLEGSATYTTGVHRLKFDLFNGASSAGFSNAVSDISGDIGTQVSQVTHFRIAGSLKAGITNPHNGTIKEIILYTSDQSDNRFKIESNINNYYGLYNDANEWDLDTNPAWTSNASSGFTANGTDGFTITTSGTSIQQFKLRVLTTESPTDSDYFKVSFNNNDPDGLITNAQLRITSFGSGGSATTISNGFNALDIINNGGFTFAYFSINANGGGSSKTATISNFKISRIARNGFVETWYDQSGNSRPLIQTTATEQPSIVENGGFVGGVKANVATSDATMQNLQVSTDGTTPNFGTNDWANGGTKLGLMYVGSIPNTASETSTCVIWGGGRGVSSFQTGGLSLQIIKGGTDSWRLTNERQDLSPVAMTTSVSLNADNDIVLYGTADNRDFTIKVNASTNSETESADLDTREDSAISLFGSYDKNGNRYYQRSTAGVCKECYLFAGDNISEVDTISTEINKHYNIY